MPGSFGPGPRRGKEVVRVKRKKDEPGDLVVLVTLVVKLQIIWSLTDLVRTLKGM